MKLRTASVLGIVLVAATSFGPHGARAQNALEKLEQEVKAPVAEPGYLGIVADDVTDAMRGVRLIDVIPGGPAQAAGLQAEDYITSIDGRAAASLDEVAAILSAHPAGDKLAFIIRRGQEVRRVDVTLTKRPPPDQRRFNNFGRVTEQDGPLVQPAVPTLAPAPNPIPPTAPNAITGPVPPETLPTPGPRVIPHPPTVVAPEDERTRRPLPPFPPAAPQPPTEVTTTTAPAGEQRVLLGVRAVPVTPELQAALNLPEPRGALIVDVREGSPAQRVGLPLEAVIVAIDGKRIDSPQDLADGVLARGEGATIKLSYFRYGQLYERSIRLGGTDATPAAPIATPPTNIPSSVVPPSLPPADVTPTPLPPSTVPPSPSAPSLTPPSLTLPQPPIAPTAPPAPATPVESETEALRRRVRELESRLSEMEAQLKAKPK